MSWGWDDPASLIMMKLGKRMFLINYLPGFILATLYGSLFHLWKGGGIGRLIFYIALSWIGFWIGNAIGISLNLTFGKVGILQFASATLGAFLCLFIGYWFSLIRVQVE